MSESHSPTNNETKLGLDRDRANPDNNSCTNFQMLAGNSRAASQVAATIRRLLATAAPKIGDTKVQMSLLEPGKYINYQRIEDNLAIVRKRRVKSPSAPVITALT